MRSLDIGALGMQAQSTNVDVTSHNIANMTTTGYIRICVAQGPRHPILGQLFLSACRSALV